MKLPAKLEFTVPEYTILEETVIDEKSGDKVMKVQAKWQQADKINNNKRRYRKELLVREIEKMEEGTKEGKVFGASYHPRMGQAEVDDVSHIWEKVWMDEDGSCLGVAKVLPTDRGKNAQVLIKHGSLGLSSRGFGTTTQKTEVIDGKSQTFEDVNEDFKLISPGDFVLTPSVPDAGVRKLIESQFKEIDDSTDKLIEEETKMSEKIKNVDELKVAYPEMVTAIEEAAKKAAQDGLADAIQTKVDEALDAKKEAWKTEVAAELQPKIDALEESKKKTVEGIREAVVALTEIDGVVDEEDEEDEEAGGEEEKPKKDEALAKKIAALEADNAELKKKEVAREKAETDAEEDKKNQTKLKESLDETLKKDEFQLYETLIRKELVSEDGKILIDTVENVEEKVKAEKERISKTLVEAQRQKIISGDIQEKGIVPDPEKGEKPLTEEQMKTRYRQAQKSGTRLSYKEYKESLVVQE